MAFYMASNEMHDPCQIVCFRDMGLSTAKMNGPYIVAGALVKGQCSAGLLIRQERVAVYSMPCLTVQDIALSTIRRSLPHRPSSKSKMYRTMNLLLHQKLGTLHR